MEPLTGKKTLLIFLLSFGLVFAVNGYMIVKAVNTYTGEDADNAYLQGADYNRTLDRRAEQSTLGWNAAIAAERVGKGALRVLVRISGQNLQPLDGLRISGVLRHPADANRDRALALEERGAGVYVATLAHVEPGAWDIVVTAHGHPFDAARPIWLR